VNERKERKYRCGSAGVPRCELGKETVDSNLRTSVLPHEKQNGKESKEGESREALKIRTFAVRHESCVPRCCVYGALDLCKF